MWVCLQESQPLMQDFDSGAFSASKNPILYDWLGTHRYKPWVILLLQTSLRMWLWFPCLLLLHPSSSHPFAVPWMSCLKLLLSHAGCHTGVPKASRPPPWVWDGIYNTNLFRQWVSWPRPASAAPSAFMAVVCSPLVVFSPANQHRGVNNSCPASSCALSRHSGSSLSAECHRALQH